MSEGTDQTLYQGAELEPPTGFGHLPEVVYTRLEFGKKFAVSPSAQSIIDGKGSVPEGADPEGETAERLSPRIEPVGHASPDKDTHIGDPSQHGRELASQRHRGGHGHHGEQQAATRPLPIGTHNEPSLVDFCS